MKREEKETNTEIGRSVAGVVTPLLQSLAEYTLCQRLKKSSKISLSKISSMLALSAKHPPYMQPLSSILRKRMGVSSPSSTIKRLIPL
jgi:hypothetical protein